MEQRIVTYRVQPEEVEAAREAIAEFVSAIRAHEPGTLAYHAYGYLDDPTRFVHTMTFVDSAARQAHVSTDHVQRFVNRLYPLCTVQPVFRDIATVASSSDPRTA